MVCRNIGGFRRGLELAGHKCVGFCEYDKFAVASYTAMHLITDEQRERLSKMTLKERQKEILKEEYRNGEWYANDVTRVDARDIPRADIWCFGAPCQDFSVAGLRQGLDGERSSLVRRIFDLLRETRYEDRPKWLIYENVKGMLSSNRGFDYLEILFEMGELGYSIEWQNLNSKDFGVPQNRERIYTIGRLGNGSAAKVFPIAGADGENSVHVRQIGQKGGRTRNNPNEYRVYSGGGIAPTLNTMGGGGIEPHVAIPVVECIGGIGEQKSNGGTQFFQQDRIYDGTKLATALSGNLSCGANMYSIPVEISASDGIGGGTPTSEDADGEGLQGHWTADYERSFGIDQTRGGKEKVIADAIKSRYNAGFHVNRKNMHTAVGLPIIFDGYNQRLRTDGLACTLTHNCGQGTVRGGNK